MGHMGAGAPQGPQPLPGVAACGGGWQRQGRRGQDDGRGEPGGGAGRSWGIRSG